MSHSTEKIHTNTFTSEENELAISRLSNENSPPKLFQLTIDCFDEIFEYLSLSDLHSLGKTCKAMQKVAGEYYKRNYSAAERFCAKDGIYTVYSNSEGVIDDRIRTSYFNSFMPCISHKYERLDPLRYLQSNIDEFKSTKHICLESLNLNREKVQFIKKILPHIEIVQIKICLSIGNLYELMLKYCVNLKSIYVQNAITSFNGKHEWLLQHYSKLEHFEFIPNGYTVIEELNEFFARNPKVRRFSTSGEFLWRNRNEFLKSKAKLDIFEIKSNHFHGYGDSIWDLLKQLYLNGFYKRLFLYTDGVNQDLSIKSVSLPNLELLCCRWISGTFNLTFLTQLKELILLDGLNAADAEILANGLVKLERLYVDKVTLEDILPFIRRSAKLNKIKMLPKDENKEPHYYDFYECYEFSESEDEIENEALQMSHVEGDGKQANTVENQAELKNDSENPNPNENDVVNRIDNGVKTEENHSIDNKNDVGDKDVQLDGEAMMENIIENSHANTYFNADFNSYIMENIEEDENEDISNDFSNCRVLNLAGLNKERRKLPGARKVIIYVRDDVFLTTKWATKNGDINLKFIEMKRSDSYKWNHHY